MLKNDERMNFKHQGDQEGEKSWNNEILYLKLNVAHPHLNLHLTDILL